MRRMVHASVSGTVRGAHRQPMGKSSSRDSLGLNPSVELLIACGERDQSEKHTYVRTPQHLAVHDQRSGVSSELSVECCKFHAARVAFCKYDVVGEVSPSISIFIEGCPENLPVLQNEGGILRQRGKGIDEGGLGHSVRTFEYPNGFDLHDLRDVDRARF